MGFSEEEVESIVPVSKMKDLVNERTGVDPTGIIKFFKMTPRADDIPDRFALEKNGVKLLTLGTVDVAGAGCVCPEHVILKRLISHLVIMSDDVVIMDMETPRTGASGKRYGGEHGIFPFVVVIEPGARSVQTYKKVKTLSNRSGRKAGPGRSQQSPRTGR